MPFAPDQDDPLPIFTTARRVERTAAERKLWQILRSRRLARFEFGRQVPVAGYVVDFYCPTGRLVVELDGGRRHGPEAKREDERRRTRLAEFGIHVIRFPDELVLTVPDMIRRAVYAALTAPAA